MAKALLSPGDKGTMSVNVGQQPFKLQPPASRLYMAKWECFFWSKRLRFSSPQKIQNLVCRYNPNQVCPWFPDGERGALDGVVSSWKKLRLELNIQPEALLRKIGLRFLRGVDRTHNKHPKTSKKYLNILKGKAI